MIFNFASEGTLSFSQPLEAQRNSRSLQAQAPLWTRTLDSFIEISPAAATHFDRHADAVSAIDRIWCFWPSWMIAQLYSRARVIGNPEELSKGKISDHSAVAVSFLPRRPTEKNARPIPKHIAKSPIFKTIIGSFVNYEEQHLAAMCPPRILERYKELLHEASRVARDQLAFKHPHDPRTLLLLAWSISRIIWRQHVQLAELLLVTHEMVF